MSIQSWAYRSQDPSIRHLGPTAQDFYAAFHLGESDSMITSIDIEGVALLATQPLERRTRDFQARVAAQDHEIRELRQRLERLEAARP
jgi:uncharacterized protein YceH (UPF0502 family)